MVGIYGVIVFAKFFVKLFLDLFLGQLLGGNGDDGHGAIDFFLFVGFGSSFIIRAFQRHPFIGCSAVCKGNRSIVTVLAVPRLLL